MGNTIRRLYLQVDQRITHVLREPTEAFAVTLPLNDGNHKEFDGADVVERDLSLSDTCHRFGAVRLATYEMLVPFRWFGRGQGGASTLPH
jgi:hypothetical protein